MMDPVDKLIEKIFKKALHKKHQKYIDKAIVKFTLKHQLPPELILDLRQKLEAEADRIYAIVDKSILRERIQRAKYTFWITAICSTLIVGLVVGLTSGAALTGVPFIIPIVSAFVVWIVSLATIPLSYEQRIKGGMDSVIVAYDKLIKAASELNKEKIDHVNDVEKLKNLIDILSIQLENLKQQVELLSTQKVLIKSSSKEEFPEKNHMEIINEKKKNKKHFHFQFWKLDLNRNKKQPQSKVIRPHPFEV